MNWMPNHGKGSRGRPRKNRQKCVLEDAAAFTGFQKNVLDKVEVELELEETAEDLNHWREIIRHKRELLGAGHSNNCGDLIKFK